MAEYSDVKWIKLMTGLFDSEKIQLIESMPEADSLIVIWVKLLCLAGKINNGGVFIIGESIVCTEEMLATVLRRPVRRVRQALEVFEQLDMVRRIDGVLTLPNWSRYQDLDQLERKRDYMRDYMRDYRSRQRCLAESAAGGGRESAAGETPSGETESSGAAGKEGCKANGKTERKTACEPDRELYGKAQEKRKEEKRIEEKRKEETERRGEPSSALSAPDGKRPSPREVFKEYAAGNEELFEALRDFDLMRRAIRRPMTDRARELLCRKLDTFPPEQRLRVLEQSVTHSWADLYPLDGRESRPSASAPAACRYDESFYSAARSLLSSQT